jgi:hypothetical protein
MVDDKIKHEPAPEDIGYEHHDLRARSILGFLLALGIACVVVYFVLLGVYSFLEKDYARRQAPQSPLKAPVTAAPMIVTPQDVQKFPEPRLETNERTELHDFRLAEEKKLNEYAWIDQANGQVQIPIDRAMQLIVQRGLPVRPANGTGANAGNAAGTGEKTTEQFGVSTKIGTRGAVYPGSPL